MKFLNEVYNKFNFSVNMSSSQVTSNGKISQSDASITGERMLNVLFYIIYFIFVFIFFASSYSDSLFFGVKSNFVSIVFIDLLVFIISRIYFNFRRKNMFKKVDYRKLDYYKRELPSKLKVAHVRLLLNDGLVDDKSLASTILDLIDRDYLSIGSFKKEDVFNKQLVISVTNKNQSDLLSYEKFVISWLFSNGSISSDELKARLHDTNNSPSEDFNIFQGLVLLSFPIDNYYKRKNSNKTLGIFYCVSVIFFIFIVTVFANKLSPLLYLLTSVVFGVFLVNFLMCFVNYSLNDNGRKMIYEYLGLKKYLEEFSSISEKSSEDVILWDYYLPYSLALGINGLAFKEISDFFGYEIYNSYYTDSSKSDSYIQYIDGYILEGNNFYKNN